MMDRDLGQNLAGLLDDVTLEKCADVGVEHARINLDVGGKTLRDLKVDLSDRPLDSAIVMAAGPSLHRNDVALQIKQSGYDGLIISSESEST